MLSFCRFVVSLCHFLASFPLPFCNFVVSSPRFVVSLFRFVILISILSLRCFVSSSRFTFLKKGGFNESENDISFVATHIGRVMCILSQTSRSSPCWKVGC